MPPPPRSPYAVVALSVATYATLLRLLYARDQSFTSVRKYIKAVSALHSIFATALTIISLTRLWKIETSPQVSKWKLQNPRLETGPGALIDLQNSLIWGKSSLADFVTAWEAGYLIYDTLALLLESHVKDKSQSPGATIRQCIRDSPVSIIHHTVLATVLLYLQSYIATGEEKGVKVITFFLLMNGSTPLLHLRWWRKKVTGKNDPIIDLALAVVFAATRFGSVYWVLREYGVYHGFSAWEALRKQMTFCQAGTGMLVGVNALWWIGLVTQMTKEWK